MSITATMQPVHQSHSCNLYSKVCPHLPVAAVPATKDWEESRGIQHLLNTADDIVRDNGMTLSESIGSMSSTVLDGWFLDVCRALATRHIPSPSAGAFGCVKK